MNINKISSSSLILAGVIALTGCASGSGSMSSGGGGGGGDGSTTTATPLARVIDQNANIVSATGTAVSDIGTTVGSLDLPLVSAQTTNDLGNVVSNAGGIVTTLGDGLGDGLGQMGLIENPVGTTVNIVDNVVAQTGVTVRSAGTLVTNLGTGQLSALAPVTTPVGGLVDKVGEVVVDLSTKLPGVLESTPIEQITQSLSSGIVPLTSTVTSLTHQVGGATGLGEPVNNLLGTVGGTVAGLGHNISASDTPVVNSLGRVVTATGNTVSMLGILLNPEEGQGTDVGLGSLLAPVSGLLGGGLGDIGGIGGDSPVGGLLTPVTTIVSGLTGGNLGGIGGDGAVTGLLAPVTSLVGGLTGGNLGGDGVTGILAPVTGVVGSLVGGVPSGTDPVNHLVGGLAGGLTGGPTGHVLQPVVVTVQALVGTVVSPVSGGSAPSILAPVTTLLGGVLASNK